MIRRPPRSTLLSLHDALPIFWVRGMFEQLGLESYAKTSGSKGLQVYVPLNTKTSYDETKPRSEEHTSELQSRQYLVCRLLLEKKQYLRLRTLAHRLTDVHAIR